MQLLGVLSPNMYSHFPVKSSCRILVVSNEHIAPRWEDARLARKAGY